MKYLIAVLFATQLSGCLYQSVNSHDIERAQKVCEKLNSKPMQINAYFSGVEEVECENARQLLLWGRDSGEILKGKE